MWRASTRTTWLTIVKMFLRNNSMNALAIMVNNELVFEFDKEMTFKDQQLAFLDRMDKDMDSGIKIQGELLPKPDKQQRARFVVMNLIKALQQDNEAVITASCAYLVNRLPALSAVHVNDAADEIKIELVEEDYE